MLIVEHSENWRKVVGYEGFYEVSDYGRVRRALDAPRGPNSRRGRVLRHIPNGHGYPCVFLSMYGVSKPHPVHILVLTAFCGPPPAGMEALHGERGKADPALDNLRWGTHKENGEDMVVHGAATGPVLREADVIAIRSRSREGEARSRLAADFDVSVTTIRAVVTRQTWRHVA